MDLQPATWSDVHRDSRTRTALTDGGESGDWAVTEADDSYDATTSDTNFGLLEYEYSHAWTSSTTTDADDSGTGYARYAPANTYAPGYTSGNLVGLVSSTEDRPGRLLRLLTEDSVTPPCPTEAQHALGAPPASPSAAGDFGEATETFYDDPSFSATFAAQTSARRAPCGDVTDDRGDGHRVYA